MLHTSFVQNTKRNTQALVGIMYVVCDMERFVVRTYYDLVMWTEYDRKEGIIC
jgi:hypothetical protein